MQIKDILIITESSVRIDPLKVSKTIEWPMMYEAYKEILD